MLIAAAVCPHPPLLVPEVTGADGPGADELRRLRAACRNAVAVLLGAAPELLVVVGGATHTTEYPPPAGGSLRDFAVPFVLGSDPVLPLSLTIGKWLLAGAAPGGPPGRVVGNWLRRGDGRLPEPGGETGRAGAAGRAARPG